jgi:hypothetical protein
MNIAAAEAGTVADGIALVPARRLVAVGPLTWFPLRPGDRPLVQTGEFVVAGASLAELLHDQRLVEVPTSLIGTAARSGERWSGRRGGGLVGGRGRDTIDGELLFDVAGRSRVATGQPGGLLEAPSAGIVREVRPGVGILLQVAGSALDGVRAIGAPARGRLEIAPGMENDGRAAGLNVGRAGAILVMGGRLDAEMLTRARAMGIRGIVVGSLTAKNLRDFAASEARQRASLHRLPPFAVLVLDGAIRRTVASPVRAVLGALTGHEVAITGEPPQLLFDPTGIRLPQAPTDLVRVRQGPWGGREGRWAGLAGIRQFRGAVRLEAGLVEFDAGPPVPLPLADLERFT